MDGYFNESLGPLSRGRMFMATRASDTALTFIGRDVDYLIRSGTRIRSGHFGAPRRPQSGLSSRFGGGTLKS